MENIYTPKRERFLHKLKEVVNCSGDGKLLDENLISEPAGESGSSWLVGPAVQATWAGILVKSMGLTISTLPDVFSTSTTPILCTINF
jgi:hypothetical protein